MGGSATNEELLSKIIEQEAIPPEIAAVQHTDQRQTRLGYNLAWAKTYLKKVGAVENSDRGVWALTKLANAWPNACSERQASSKLQSRVVAAMAVLMVSEFCV
jgi:hypothetical protein